MTGVASSRSAGLRKVTFFAACFGLELSAFAILPLGQWFPMRPLLYLQGCITGIFLTAALLARRAGRVEWQVLHAFFAGSAAILLSTLFGDLPLESLSLVPVGPAWIGLARLSEAAWRVVTVVVLMAAGGAGLRSMYLTSGRLGLGLGVGLAGFAVCASVAFLPSLGSLGGWNKLVSLSPWILSFALANGFSEELLFRGLFLQRYERFLGKALSNVLAAAAFTVLRVHAAHVPELAMYLLIFFPLALTWGWLMRKTGSLWGPALFHAGADCLIVFGIYVKP